MTHPMLCRKFVGWTSNSITQRRPPSDPQSGRPVACITDMKTPSHLIVVCCHGIWIGGSSNGEDESEWLLADFQAGESPTFIEHIKAGLGVLCNNDNSVLMFSGGPTRKETALSEAQSYLNLATANSYYGVVPTSHHPRLHIEDRALDSYQNILFSILQFWRIHSFVWPSHLTIVSHGFKQQRLVDGHCQAIAYPMSRISFVGVDPPYHLGMGNAGTANGNQTALYQWAEDPHGEDHVLVGKRGKRNPWGIEQALFLTDEERARSGLVTRPSRDGTTYVLEEGGVRPWHAG